MPTEQQLIEALRRADVAGNKRDAEQIAGALRQVRAQGGQDTRPTSFWQGFKEEIAKANANVARMMQYNPIAPRVGGGVEAAIIDRARKQGMARSPYRGSTMGRIAGGVVATLPTLAVPGGPLAQGALGGAVLSEAGGDPLGMARDATIGAVAGKAGDVVGRRVVAPAAERIGRTAPVRAVAERAARALRKAPLPLPRITRAERMIGGSPDIAGIRAIAADAQRLNLPIALADTNPKLRALAGSAARFSPQARELAESTFEPRAAGQAERAVNAIDEYLAPITNIEERAGAIKQQAWNAADPFYREAFEQAAPIDEGLAEMLRRPAGKAALQNAYRIAQNEGRDPLSMGFDLDDQGEVVIKKMPSMETLDLVKRGFDDVLNDFRNPVTQRLELEGKPEAQSVNALLTQFKAKLDEISEPYAKARSVYSENIAPRTALQTGYGTLPKTNLPQRQFDAALAGMNPRTTPEAQRGFATALADEVAKRRMATNPYDAIYGSPLQRGKVASMFPQGADDFGRTYALEKEMQKTATELLGGSQTQPRAMADAQFASGIGGDVIDAGVQLATGGGIPGATSVARRALGGGIKDRARLGLFGAQTKAEQLAPLLYDANPGNILAILDEIARKNAEMEIRKAAYGNALGGLFGVPAAGAVLGAQ